MPTGMVQARRGDGWFGKIVVRGEHFWCNKSVPFKCREGPINCIGQKYRVLRRGETYVRRATAGAFAQR